MLLVGAWLHVIVPASCGDSVFSLILAGKCTVSAADWLSWTFIAPLAETYPVAVAVISTGCTPSRFVLLAIVRGNGAEVWCAGIVQLTGVVASAVLLLERVDDQGGAEGRRDADGPTHGSRPLVALAGTMTVNGGSATTSRCKVPVACPPAKRSP